MKNPKLIEYQPETPMRYAQMVSEITLRDLFAAFALAGMMNAEPPIDCDRTKYNAAIAYHYADAMLAERTKGRS